jgi:excinuclease ABC subunit C
MKNTLLEKLDSVSPGPGIYLMKDIKGTVIYAGKAANLKKRLASYFARASQHGMKTGVLVKKIASFETILTTSEKEALILESNLIKHHKPRYNVILKDDKRYPSIRIDINSEYPCLKIVRMIKHDGAVYFGPYASAGAVKQTVKLINKTFKLRKCISTRVKKRSRPCLNYQMGLCHAPCCYHVDKRMYGKIANEVRMFLNGRTHELIKTLKNEMMAASKKQKFEKAAFLRDKIFALEKTMEKQVVVTADFIDRDVIGIARKEGYALVVVLLVRKGFLQGVRQFVFKDAISADAEIVRAFFQQYYEGSDYIPKEIIIPFDLHDAGIYAEWFSNKKQANVKILYPKRGDKVRLVKMAIENAQTRLKSIVEEALAGKALLLQVERRLRLNSFPKRIECFDNSGLSGKNMVAGMVVFVNGKPEKTCYRRYKIKNVDSQDDYACMREVLERRFKKNNKNIDFPDLLMVDGGKGQLNIALSVLDNLGLKNAFDVIGLAKKEAARNETQDKVYMPGRSNPVNFGKEMETLFFLQRIRDEAHRYAIAFHRRTRIKTALHSRLDDIPGIGKKRKAALLKQFMSFKKIRDASIDELVSVSGINRKVATAILDALAG